MREGLSSRNYRGARPASPLLLLLFFHAFLVSATHYHRFEPVTLATGRAEVGVGADGGATRAAEPAGHAQCLLCRFQRDFLTDFRKTYTPGDHGPESTLALCDAPACVLSDRPFSVPSGRAPPLA